MTSKMPFYQYHRNRLEKGSTVVVKLGTGANVRLMDSSTFSAFKNGRNHKIRGGGLVKTTPGEGNIWHFCGNVWLAAQVAR